MKTNATSFNALLSRYKRSWQFGLYLGILFQTAGWAIVGLSIYAICDFILSFSQATRIILDGTFVSILFVLLTWQSVRIFKLSDKDAAVIADQSLGSRRQDILTALELSSKSFKNQGRSQDLQAYLITRSTEKASNLLARASLKQRYPAERLMHQCKMFCFRTIFCTLIFGIQFSVGSIVLKRIFMPHKDIPPYSRYVFKVTPEQPRALYGGEVELSVEISGRPVRSQVWFVTRKGNKTHELPCFQISETSYVQRMEKMVCPVEFCFRTGRARSKWHRIELLLQPRIEKVRATVIPPAYSGQPEREFVVGDAPLEGLKGSKVNLFVTSNRPLSGGQIIFRTQDSSNSEISVKGRIFSRHTIQYSWRIQEKAKLSISFSDEQGIRNKDKYTIHQRIIKDNPPSVSITEPSSFVMATAGSALPLNIRAEDDLGLRSVEIIRTVVGYRDRAKFLGPDYPSARFDFSDRLNLKNLGVAAGQVLEFYLEATDHNPSMTGISASEIMRVRIISESKYAEMLRLKEGMEQFSEKYRLLSKELEEFIEQAKALQMMLRTQNAARAEIEEKLDKLRKQNLKAFELFHTLSEDFSIYDFEKQTAPQLDYISNLLNSSHEILKAASAQDPDLSHNIEKVLEELISSTKKLDKHTRDAETITKIGRIMACAVRYRRLYDEQEKIVRRMQLYIDQNKHSDTGPLKMLENRQQTVREKLLKLKIDMENRAEALPQEAQYDELRSSTQKFAQLIEGYAILNIMAASAEAAGNHDVATAFGRAQLALEKMDKLFSDCNGTPFGGFNRRLCFKVEKHLQATLQQIMNALWAGAAAGDGSGYSMGNYSPLNVPFYGPARASFRQAGAQGPGNENSTTGRNRIGADAREKIKHSVESDLETINIQIENAPEKYREALKRYFHSFQ